MHQSLGTYWFPALAELSMLTHFIARYWKTTLVYITTNLIAKTLALQIPYFFWFENTVPTKSVSHLQGLSGSRRLFSRRIWQISESEPPPFVCYVFQAKQHLVKQVAGAAQNSFAQGPFLWTVTVLWPAAEEPSFTQHIKKMGTRGLRFKKGRNFYCFIKDHEKNCIWYFSLLFLFP